ncbi:mitochondrial nucleoid-associated protein 1 [Pterocles gutturalis]
MAAVPPGQELCPHCHRPFKRLRAHLPHCKAAPRPAPGSAPPPSQGLGPRPAASNAPGPGRGPAAGPRSGSGSGGAAVGPGAGAAGKSSKRLPGPSVGRGLPGADPREAAAAARKGEKAAAERGGGAGPGLCHQPDRRRAEQKVEPAVQDVAKCLDLLPEEVKDLPERLSKGVRIAIEKHRAKVMREQSGSRSRGAPAGSHRTPGSPGNGMDPGSAAGPTGTAPPEPREGPTVPKTTETASLGAAEDVSASSKGGKGGSLKATKPSLLLGPPGADCRSSPGGLFQQEGTNKTTTEEKQMYLEVGVEYKALLPALHTKNLHLSAMEGFRGHSEGTSKNYLTSIQKLRESEKQMAVVSEPVLKGRRDTELALHQFLLHTSKSHPICPSQAPGRRTPAGLEWFPDLHPNYDGLSIFPRKRFQEDVGITTKTPKGSFSEGQQGPLSERRLMDVRLGELPAWLATCDFSPQGLLGGVQKAWSSYYDKYINVKRGGPAGISLLLAGYCLLSYGWNYQHIKCYRWRKYH